MYVRKGGPTHNYKIRKGGPRKKYVCKEGGVKKFSCHPPPYFFFGMALIIIYHNSHKIGFQLITCTVRQVQLR